MVLDVRAHYKQELSTANYANGLTHTKHNDKQ
jgi:hypothetical protein